MDNLQALTEATETAAQLLAVWSWQALLLLIGVWLTLKFFRSRAAALRYQVWLLALLSVAALPLWAIAISWFPVSPVPQPRAAVSLASLIEIPEAVMFPVQTQSASVEEKLAPDTPFQARATFLSSLVWNMLFIVWASGALITAGRIYQLYWRLRRARRTARRTSIANLSLEEAAGWELSNSKQISIRLSPNVQSPILFGVRHPTILLPADIRSWTTAEERAAILRHELAHLDRRDHYVNLFQALLSAIFFFHPLVRYALNQLSLERELACDKRVLTAGTAATAYANSLLKVAERNLMPETQHQAASFATRKTLERRVEMILNNQPHLSNTSRWSLLALSTAVIASITWLIVPSRPVVAASQQQQQQHLQASRTTENKSVTAAATTVPAPALERRTAATPQPSSKQNQASAETASTRRSLQKPIATAALPARTSGTPLQNSSSDDEQAIRSLLREAADANVQNNLAVLNRYIADDFVSTGLRGEVMNKAEALAHFKVGDHKYEAVDVDDLKVRVFDNTAVATYIVTAKGKYRGEDFSVQNRNTTMLIKRQGRWQAIADQQTRKQ